MASLFESLAVTGHRKSDGSANASGKAFFYKPGGTSLTAIYANEEEAPLTNPVTLSAGGKAQVFFTGQVDVFFEDFLGNPIETLTLSERAERVEVKNAGFTGLLPSGSQGAGGATDLNAVLASIYASVGGLDGQYLEFTGATARTLRSVIQGIQVSVKDYGAIGNGVADDTVACQNAINEVGRLGGGNVYFDPGTYNISSALTVTTSSVLLYGAGAASVIKNTNGTANAFLLSGCSDVIVDGLKVSHSATSSGFGISVVNGTNITLRNITVAGHARLVSVTGTSTRTRISDSFLTLPSGSTNVGVYYSAGNYHSISGTSILPTSGGKLVSFDGTSSYASIDSCVFAATTDGGIVFEATLTGLFFTILNSPSLSQFAANKAFICNIATVPVVTQSGNGVELQASTADITSGGTYTPNLFCAYSSVFATGVTTGVAYTVAPPNPALHLSQAGKIVTMRFHNTAGGPVTGWTFNAIYRINGAISLVDTQTTSLIFLWDGAAMREIGRAITT